MCRKRYANGKLKMLSHFKILLSGILGVERKSGRESSIFVFYRIFSQNLVRCPPPLSPLPLLLCIYEVE
jgi:hypothetical protein